MVLRGTILEEKNDRIKSIDMSKKEFFYCKDVIRFSLKNATKPISTIRLRVNLHGERLTFYLPVEYKIQPKHWDKEMGCAIEDCKRNADLKGDIRLQLILRNINKEIEKPPMP